MAPTAAVTSEAGDDGTYVMGDTIRVQLTFRETVTVTGTPRLKIDFSSEAGDERWADYSGGSGTKTLEFSYTVAAGDVSSAGVAVLANTLEVNGGTIVLRRPHLLHPGLDHDPNHRVTGDATPPALSGKAVDGTKLTLRFDEPLGAAASLVNSAFTVKKTPQGGAEETVSLTGSPAIDGATITLTLASAVLETDTDVKVSYAKPGSGTGNRIVDAAGNEAAGFADEPVANVAGGDTTPPRLVRGEIDGGTMTLFFSEALDPNSLGGYFFVSMVRSSGVRITFDVDASDDVEIIRNAVTVRLEAFGGPVRAKAGVSDNFAYYLLRPSLDPTLASLRDLAGNPVSTPIESLSGLRTRHVNLDNFTGVAPTAAVTSEAGR